jgi:hypothetical protein
METYRSHPPLAVSSGKTRTFLLFILLHLCVGKNWTAVAAVDGVELWYRRRLRRRLHHCTQRTRIHLPTALLRFVRTASENSTADSPPPPGHPGAPRFVARTTKCVALAATSYPSRGRFRCTFLVGGRPSSSSSSWVAWNRRVVVPPPRQTHFANAISDAPLSEIVETSIQK